MNKQVVSISSFVLLMVAACGNARQPDRAVTMKLVVDDGEVDNASVVVSSDAMKETRKNNGCKEGMVRVTGEWCRNVEQKCERWIDPPEAAARRCAEYYPTVCLSKKLEHKDFCIDVTEYTVKEETLPMVNVDFFQAEKLCENDGKRLCKETEWEMSCEGPEMFPYTTGLKRNCDVCNCDVTHGLGKVGALNDLRKTSNEISSCQSEYGVLGQNGNVDEITVRDHSGGHWKNALKGGWWGPIRARCRPATIAHGDLYSDRQLGFRCCSDP